jgi:hypothetical protein
MWFCLPDNPGVRVCVDRSATNSRVRRAYRVPVNIDRPASLRVVLQAEGVAVQRGREGAQLARRSRCRLWLRVGLDNADVRNTACISRRKVHNQLAACGRREVQELAPSWWLGISKWVSPADICEHLIADLDGALMVAAAAVDACPRGVAERRERHLARRRCRGGRRVAGRLARWRRRASRGSRRRWSRRSGVTRGGGRITTGYVFTMPGPRVAARVIRPATPATTVQTRAECSLNRRLARLRRAPWSPSVVMWPSLTWA